MKRILAVLLFIGVLSAAGIGHAGNVAVIVHKSNRISEVSLGDLVRIFRQERRYWRGSQKIYLIMRENLSPEKTLFLKKIYRMESKGLKKFWLTKIFRGQIASLPKTLNSNEAVVRFVGRVPPAVSFIDFDAADNSIKILRIDGKFPGEPGYPLAD